MTDTEIRALLDPHNRYPLLDLAVLVAEAAKRKPAADLTEAKARKRAKYHARRKTGLCLECDKKTEHARCEYHRAKRRSGRAHHRQIGRRVRRALGHICQARYKAPRFSEYRAGNTGTLQYRRGSP